MRILEASAALARLMPLALHIYQGIDRALDNGQVTADEAAAIGAQVAADLGDVRLMVRGRDVLGDVAQAELGSALGRVGLRLARALRA